jgi:hypothetical protein
MRDTKAERLLTDVRKAVAVRVRGGRRVAVTVPTAAAAARPADA